MGGGARMRRGLVLGCGGPVGFAWTVAVLRELEAAWDWDAGSADLIVGTSAGAELACLLGGGVLLADVHRALNGDADVPAWLSEHIAYDAGRFPRALTARLGSPRLALAALRGTAPRLAGMTGVAPVGVGDPGWLRRLARRMANESGWVDHPATWLVASDFDTGARVAFGAPGAPPAMLADALNASWGLPTWLAPVPIARRRYVDGGVLSPASADLAAPLELDEVVVLAPMASSAPGRPVGLLARGERIVRRHMTAVLDAEVAAVERAGTRVWRFEPTGRELAVMGGNFMDRRRQAATMVAATATVREWLSAAPRAGAGA